MDKNLCDLCTGCGLCKSINKASIDIDNKGFYHPCSGDNSFLRNICPSMGLHRKWMDKKQIWGKNESVYLGWSNSEEIRKKASSGGILTSLCIYLIEQKKVDGIFHTGINEVNPTETSIYISRKRDEVINNCGSRYTISHPLEHINLVNNNEKYVFIGKPCDVIVLRNYIEINSEYKKVFPYLFSFFCMGSPSIVAQKRLLMRMNLSFNNCKHLSYRGNGWPGYSTAIGNDGSIHKLSYSDSWGKILGRDLMPACRYCIDGIGECADVSCGDAWYVNEQNEPDFSEHEGRNVIFTRSIKGQTILDDAFKKGYIHLEPYLNFKTELRIVQASQYNRRAYMLSRIIAAKMFGKTVPNIDLRFLYSYSRNVSLLSQFRSFFGTIKRIIKKKI